MGDRLGSSCHSLGRNNVAWSYGLHCVPPKVEILTSAREGDLIWKQPYLEMTLFDHPQMIKLG